MFRRIDSQVPSQLPERKKDHTLRYRRQQVPHRHHDPKTRKGPKCGQRMETDSPHELPPKVNGQSRSRRTPEATHLPSWAIWIKEGKSSYRHGNTGHDRNPVVTQQGETSNVGSRRHQVSLQLHSKRSGHHQVERVRWRTTPKPDPLYILVLPI